MRYAKLKGTLAALAFAGLGSGAMAATVGTIPQGASNEALAIWTTNVVEGWYGATLYATGDFDVTVEYWGAEASNNNRFNMNDGDAVFSTGSSTSPGGNFTGSAIGSSITVGVTAGMLNFWFGANQNSSSVANGFNPDASGGATVGPNFFLSFGDTPDLIEDGNSLTSGSVVWLFFDDLGATDDNHDDMVIKLIATNGSFSTSPIPVPAGGLLLLGGLAGLAALKRRRRAA